MIEQQKINGRNALVAYLSATFEPVDAAKAELVKVIFADDGSSMWLTPATEGARDAKLSHKEANYGPGHSPTFCHACRYYVTEGSHCRLVEDPIEAQGWCELWKKADGDVASA